MQEINAPLGEIVESPWQPTGRSTRKIDELAASMAAIGADGKPRGQLEAGLARPKDGKFELVAGCRRLNALKVNHHASPDEEAFATMRLIVREMSDEEAREIFYISNAQREDLTPMEEAREFGEMRAQLGWNAETISARTGKPIATVYRRLQLLKLIAPAQEALEAGVMSLDFGQRLSMLQTEADQAKALEKALASEAHGKQDSSRKRLAILDEFARPLSNAPFDTADAALVKAAGACNTCTKRSAAQLSMWAEAIHERDHCLDASCFAAKFDAAWKVAVKAAKNADIRAIEGKEAEEIFAYGGTTPSDPKYVALDAPWPDDSASPPRTYREILGKAIMPSALVRTAAAIIEITTAAEAIQALVDAGLIKAPKPSKQSSGAASSAHQREQAAMRPPSPPAHPKGDDRLEAALGAIYAKAKDATADVHVWRFLAGLVIRMHGMNVEACERRGLTLERHTGDACQAALREWATTAEVPALLALIVELLVSSWASVGNGVDDEGVQAALRFFGIDLGRLNAGDLSGESRLEGEEGDEDPDKIEDEDEDEEAPEVEADLLMAVLKSAFEEGPLFRDSALAAAESVLEEEGIEGARPQLDLMLDQMLQDGALVIAEKGKIGLPAASAEQPAELTHITAKMLTGKRGRPTMKRICETEHFDKTRCTEHEMPAGGPSCEACKVAWKAKPQKDANGKKVRLTKAPKEARPS